MPPELIGQGRYRVLSVVGRGGEATVVKAADTRHDRLVALKIRPVPTDDAAATAQLAETRALLSLPGHEGLAHARDDFFDDGRHVLVLDWVEGIDLAKVLSTQGTPGLPASSVVRWLAQAAEALTILHSHGVLHGDVKPANLVLDQRGRVVVVDLGSSSVPGHIGPGGGTPGFRAPELAAGEPATRASDVYGLAATAFALLTGAAPVGVLPSWHDVAPEQASVLEGAVRAGLALDPARRPATPGELVERLRAGWGDGVSSGVMTVMLTDVVGSTELWGRIPSQMPAVLAGLQLAVDVAVEGHGGTRLGATVEGDSTVSAFAGAADALAAAVSLQRALVAPTSANELPPVRVGLATGEVVSAGADIAGATVSRAARIRDLAGAGEILLSSTTASVVTPALPADVALVSLGRHALRGIGERDEVHAVQATGVVTPPDPSRCPYPGLAAFQLDDAPYFVGREVLVDECLARLARHRFVGLVGGSGAGKSSLARAGLAPRLEHVLVLTPGEHPMAALEAGLDDAPTSTTLVVDQFEEVVTLCRDRGEQGAFLDAVRAHRDGVVVVLRADLYGELAGFGEFSDLLAANHLLVGPLAGDDFERAIVEPAERCGLTVEPGLAEIVVSELGNEPGMLPLLAHALRETWMRRDGRRLTVSGYRSAGGVEGAIARTAAAIFDELDERDRALARDLLLRMVEVRDDGNDARRWVELSEIQSSRNPNALVVLERLAAARLVTVDGPRATLAHEALLSAWAALREWIRDERDSLVVRQQVRRAAAAWIAGGRSEADLYRGARLEATIEWRDAAPRDLTAREAEFIEASEAEAESERRALAERIRRQTRQNRRLRVLLGTSAVALVVALLAAAVAVRSSNEADQRANDADVARLVSQSQSLVPSKRDVAALLAVAASEREPGPATDSALLTAVYTDPSFVADLRPGAIGGRQAMFDPDGESMYIVTETPDQPVLRYELGSGDVTELDLGEDDSAVYPFVPVGDDRVVHSVGDGSSRPDPVIRLVDSSTGEVEGTVDVGAPPADFLLSPDGRRLLVSAFESGSRSARVEVYDLPSLDLVASVSQPGTTDEIAWLGSAWIDDDRIAVGSPTGRILVWRPSTDEVVQRLNDPPVAGPVATELRATEDGSMLVGVGEAGMLAFDLDTGRPAWSRPRPANMIFSIDDRHGQVWAQEQGFGSSKALAYDLRTGEPTGAVRDGQHGSVCELAIGADDRLLVMTSCNEASASVWSLDGGNATARGLGDVGSFTGTWNWSDDGSVVVYEEDVGRSFFVDLATGERRPFPEDDLGPTHFVGDGTRVRYELAEDRVVVERPGEDPESFEVPLADNFQSMALTPDGSRTVVLGGPIDETGVVEVIDVTAGRILRRIEVDVGGTLAAAFAPDGRRLAVAGLDERSEIYDVGSGDLVGTLDRAANVAYSPDGQLIAANAFDGTVAFYDAETLEPVGDPLPGATAYTNVMGFAADGRVLVTAGLDNTLRFWDVGTRQQLGPGITVSDHAFAVSPDGMEVAVSTPAGVQRFTLDRSALREAACRIAGRELTDAEWERHLGGSPHALCEGGSVGLLRLGGD